MKPSNMYNPFRRNSVASGAFLAIFTVAAFYPGWAISDEAGSQVDPPTHMSDALRTSIKKIVVLPTTSPVSQGIAGSYEKQTPGLLNGADDGRRIGTFSKDIGPVVFVQRFPVLELAGMLFGGISGDAKRRIQNFHDALTEDLAQAAGDPLSNDALASDVFWGIRDVPDLDAKVFALTTPIPGDTDSILYVSMTDIIINVQDKNAIITTSASASVRRMSDGAHVYEKQVQYQDQGELKDWTKDDNAHWRDYANFARHYIAREISGEVFERVDLQHELRPKETDNVDRVKKNDWQGVSKTLSPTLAWESNFKGGDTYGSWASEIDEADISYDVDIYDMHRRVYSAKQVPDTSHTVGIELPCKTPLRWSVRPAYHVGSDIKFGEWMRFNTDADSGNGNVGKNIDDAPAYLYDFASLEIKCRRR